MEASNYRFINVESINELSGGDDEFLKEIMEDVMNTLPPYISDLSAAIEASDEEKIKFISHKIKGTFRFIGCDEIGNIIEKIEVGVGSLSGAEMTLLMQDATANYKEIEAELNDLVSKL